MDESWNLVGAFALGIITCSVVGALMTSVSNTKPSFAPYTPRYDFRSYHHRR